MMKYLGLIMAGLIFTACSSEDDSEIVKEEGGPAIKQSQSTDTKPSVDLERNHEVVDNKELSNGIKIKWFEHGEGEKVKSGDMIDIDYKVLLEDGDVVDGNHLMERPSFPFMVGFQMQNEGWDLALQELKVGDFVEIFLPSKYARGKKSIDGLIPENANNILKLRVLNLNEPTRVIDGTRVWLMDEEPKNTDMFSYDKRVLFHCWASSPTNPLYFNTEWENNPYNFGLGDGGLVPGLRKALINAKKADLMLVHIPAKEAYGSKGFQDLVKPNEDLLYRVFVMEVRDK